VGSSRGGEKRKEIEIRGVGWLEIWFQPNRGLGFEKSFLFSWFNSNSKPI
jgi:hypothetical protein